MDTTAYLHSQGWLGTGHALAARGLSKPLLVSQKQNVLGVGKKRHDAHADQWWARAFDGCLKGLEVSRVVDGKVGGKGKGGILGGGKKGGDGVGNGEKGGSEVGVRVEGRGGGLDALRSGSGGRSGLYGFFVRGEGLRGTFVEETVVAVNGKGGIEKGWGAKESEGQGGEERAERKRKRKERKELEVADAVAVVEEEEEEDVPDEELGRRLRKQERRMMRRAGHGAEDGAEDDVVTETAIAEITQGVSSSSLRKKKGRRVAASNAGASPDLVTSEDRVTTETSVSDNCEPKAMDEADPKAMRRKEKPSVEKLERRRRKTARRALKAEQTRLGDCQAGQGADETNKTHTKRRRKYTEN